MGKYTHNKSMLVIKGLMNVLSDKPRAVAEEAAMGKQVKHNQQNIGPQQ